MINEEDYARLEEALLIDKDDLDRMVIEQSQHFQEVGRQCAMAQSRAAAAKIHRNATRGRRFAYLKRKAADEGERMTIPDLEAALESDKKHRAAIDKYIQAEMEAESWVSLREAWKSRGFQLRDMVQLFLASYFSSDSEYDEVREALGSARRKKSSRKKTRRKSAR